MKIKKIISIALSLLLMIGTFSPFSAFAYSETNKFGDEFVYSFEEYYDFDTNHSALHLIYEYGDFWYSVSPWSNVHGVFIHGYTGDNSCLRIPNTIHDMPVIRIYGLNAISREYEKIEGVPNDRIKGVETLIKELYIPSTVERINEEAFIDYIALEKVVFEDNSELKCVGPQAFEGCCSLKTISLPKKLIEIQPAAFYGCKSLKSINIPESTKSIGESAFQNSGLTSITIPKNVKTIYKNAFKGCENLTSVKFAGAVNNIGKSAFSKCVNLKTVNFTKGYLKKVYDYAFYKCEKLDKVTISNTKNVPTIAKSAFNKAKSGIKFYVKNNTVAKKLKSKLQKTNIKKAKIYRSAPILIYKNVG